MKKLILMALCVGALSAADNTVYFQRDTLAAATTNYILIQRSNDSTLFRHAKTASDASTFVKSMNIEMSSNTTSVKLGYVYDVNASSANIRWFDKYTRKAADAPKNIIVDYTGGSLFSRNWLVLSDSIFPIDSLLDANFASAKVFQTYKSGTTASVAKGDVVMNVVGVDTLAGVKVIIIYDVR